MNDASTRVAACDLGKATARFLSGRLDPDGTLRLDDERLVVHEGRPFDAFRRWYDERRIADCAGLAATGLYAEDLRAPVWAGLPEDACLESALAQLPELQGPLNLVSVGARGYGVLVRDEHGRVTYLENDKCSSGTGETMVKIAGRFGLGVDEADDLARAARDAIAITARCSVFAKSEMTHFGNQGEPADRLFRGYFESVARYVAALLRRVQVPGPVYAIGGGSRLQALVDGMAEALGAPVVALPQAMTIEALGALRFAAEQVRSGDRAVLPRRADDVIAVRQVAIATLPPATAARDRVTRMTVAAPPVAARRRPAVLGLDLGSTGSKAVLTDLATGELVFDLYDRTRGNPVGAAQRLVAALLDAVPDADVRAVGLTGSGREAAATVLRAAFPAAADRIVVINEIVAHATAAIHCDPEGGRSLSVVEIGGQDAKFIQIAHGQIVESDMNKACSAGTGSFLEEQAVFYGIHDIGEFTELAMQAETPPDLGQMCTVFVAEAAGAAHQEGFDLPDLFGGFQYAVIHNYINRVMGERTFGERIFFQGKPASGPALAWTLAAVAERDVVVPPNPGAMGAWGIGLCAREELGVDALADAPRLSLAEVLLAAVVDRQEFQCRDKSCATLCRIERTTVAVDGDEATVLSGGACPKYEVASAGRRKLPKEAPDAFAERQALLAPYSEADPTADAAPMARTVGIVHAGAYEGILPWLATFLRELGLRSRVLRADAHSLARGEERSDSFDACAPVKVVLGVADADVDVLFMPKILGLGGRDGTHGVTCPMEQAIPEVVRASQGARGGRRPIVQPRLDMRSGWGGLRNVRALLDAAASLGADASRVPLAVQRAGAAQEAYEAALAAIGRRTLSYGAEAALPVVVVCGMPHVVYDPVVGAGVPGMLRQNGVLALPGDCMPLPAGTPPLPRVPWADANRTLRAALAARAHGRAYPLLLTSFGCGPMSFVEHVMNELMAGYPHTTLESDGHGGGAGYVTRIQAFLHTVTQHDGRGAPVPGERLRPLEPLTRPKLAELRDQQLVTFPLGDGVGPLLAASYRSLGLAATAAGPASTTGLRTGRRDCSGKECIPYQLIWGSHRQHLDDVPPTRDTVLLQASGEGMCRNCMFPVKDSYELSRLDTPVHVSTRALGTEPETGTRFIGRFFLGAAAWDLLYQLLAWCRPGHADGAADDLYADFLARLEKIVEQPQRDGARGLLDQARAVRAVVQLLDEAGAAFARLLPPPDHDDGRRTVLVTGDIYVRLDPFASNDLIRKLNDRGLRVLTEPLNVLGDYLGYERSSEIIGLPTGRVSSAVLRRGMRALRGRLYATVARHHRWLEEPDVDAMVAASRRLIDRYPVGEAPITVGSVLHAWHEHLCDGIVIASPWGCGPALIAESLLRPHRQIPMLFTYHDGSPLDERRLNGFAYRLARAPRHRVEPGVATARVATAHG